MSKSTKSTSKTFTNQKTQLEAEIARLKAENVSLAKTKNRRIVVADPPSAGKVAKGAKAAKAKPEPKPEPKAVAVVAPTIIDPEDILYLIQCFAREMGVPRDEVLAMVAVIAEKELKSLGRVAEVVATAITAS